MAVTLNLIAKATPAPYGPLALAYYLQQSIASASISINFVHTLPDSANATLEADGASVVGQDAVLKKLGDMYATEGLCGKDKNDSAQIEALLLSIPPSPPSFGSATAFLCQLERVVTLRTFLVGHSLSLADWAVWGALRANHIARVQLGQFPHTSRWYNFVSEREEAGKAVEELAAQAKVKPAKEKKEKVPTEELKGNATFDLGLPNAVMGQVTTRFPPEPSGYLHIGHAKAAILNQYFAKLYKGKFLIRFDDTNPSKEKAEFEQSIIEDLAMMGVKGDGVTYTSNYFDQLHQYCVQIIQSGQAYADDTEQERMRAERMDGIASARRESSIEDNMARFAEMATGSIEGLRWCIRAKMSVDDPNKALRDPVIYRTNPLPHHRTGDKFKIYPTYDFACPIVDSLEGVTHALRTNEYRDRNPQYQWMLTALGLRKVEIWDFGRVNFVYTLLSKRKLKWFVEEGHVRSWDDPRFATVRGIRRRGLTIEALTQYMLLQGPSQAFTNLEWDVIWTINKRIIDPVVPRFVALEKQNLVKVTLSGPGLPSAPETKEFPRHKKNEESGTKETVFANVIYVEQADAKSFAVDEEITLMDWGNAYVRKINGSATVDSIEMELHIDGDFKKTKKKVTWLAESPERPLVATTLLDYDYLITKKKLEEDDKLTDFITPVTEFRVDAMADFNVKSLATGDTIQFERKGYYIVDSAYGEPSRVGGDTDCVELVFIPDGKASSVVSKAAAAIDAAAPPAKAVPVKGKAKAKESAATPAPSAKGGRIPIPAPSEAVETVMLSEGSKGFEQKVTTKMYAVDSIYGDVSPQAKTEMYKVSSLY